MRYVPACQGAGTLFDALLTNPIMTRCKLYFLHKPRSLLEGLLSQGKIKIRGAVLNLATGKVDFCH
ncbi:MAG: hypothetical protein ABL867_09700, partial [Rickettsiales bacterium]